MNKAIPSCGDAVVALVECQRPHRYTDHRQTRREDHALRPVAEGEPARTQNTVAATAAGRSASPAFSGWSP